MVFLDIWSRKPKICHFGYFDIRFLFHQSSILTSSQAFYFGHLLQNRWFPTPPYRMTWLDGTGARTWRYRFKIKMHTGRGNAWKNILVHFFFCAGFPRTRAQSLVSWSFFFSQNENRLLYRYTVTIRKNKTEIVVRRDPHPWVDHRSVLIGWNMT